MQRKHLALLAGLLVLAALAAGFLSQRSSPSGDSLPKGTAVEIEGGAAPITQQQVRQWTEVLALQKPENPPELKPPFSGCDKIPECREMLGHMRRQAVDQLITLRWVEAEAKQKNFPEPTAKQLREAGEDEYSRAITDPQLKRYWLRMRFFDRYNFTQAGVYKRPHVPEQELQRIYQQRKSGLEQPAQRSLEMIVSASRAKAQRARQALDGGMELAQALARYGSDPALLARGGQVLGLREDADEPAPFLKAVFAAPAEADTTHKGLPRSRPGAWQGPVRYGKSWAVFRVIDSKQGRRSDYQALRKQLLEDEQSRRSAYNEERFRYLYIKRWRDKTLCSPAHAKLSSYCRNGIKLGPFTRKPL